MRRGHVTHILVVLQEDVEVEVLPEDRMSRHATQEDLVHGDSLLEDGEVLSERGKMAVSTGHRWKLAGNSLLSY